jgi:two-component system response regulator AtoC
LRERPEDLPLLIDALLDRLNRELGLQIQGVTPEARRLMALHDWPGNVRELENTLRRAAILCDTPAIGVQDLPPRIRGEIGNAPAADAQTGMTLADACRRAVEKVERTLIQASLAQHRGNRSETADSLGINRKTLFNKLRMYGMTMEDEAEPE